MTKFLAVITLILLASGFVFLSKAQKSETIVKPPPPPTASPTPFQTYHPPQIAEKEAYTIIFVGDSMTEILGENMDGLRKNLAVHFPDKVFGLFNYSSGSSNILSVDDRLTKDTTFFGKTFMPILNREFEVIILESFGHNPLSQYPLEEGLMKQTETLTSIVTKLVSQRPGSAIIFLATIAPSRSSYALNQRDLAPDVRAQWAEERAAYIENHIRFANSHQIPVINVYEKSLSNGEANLAYISNSDFIHPSPAGVELLSREIADFLFSNHTLIP